MFFLKKSSVALLSVVLLAGCKLGPNYQRPSQVVPAEFRTPATATSRPIESTATANAPWWEVFQDPQLQTLIEIAVEENQDLKIAAARIEEARAIVGVASSSLFPQVGAGGFAQRTRVPEASRSMVSPPSPVEPEGVWSPARFNTYGLALDLSYEVDLFGRLRRSKESAREELFATAEARNAILSSVVTETARSYFALLELDREIEITSETLNARQKTLRLMELRRKEGTASDLEVNRFKAEVSATQAALAVLQQQVFQTENALSVLMGQKPDRIERSSDAWPQDVPAVPAGLPSEMLNRRPDLLEAEHVLSAATARIGAAKAAFFPRIALTGQEGLQSAELSNLLNSDSSGWNIAGQISQPIFQGGRNWFNLKATRAQQKQALENYRKTVLEALREVSDALSARQQFAQERINRETQVRALEDSVRLGNLRYDAGQSSYLELLDAEQQLHASQLQLEQARLQEILASVRLYKALGGLIEK